MAKKKKADRRLTTPNEREADIGIWRYHLPLFDFGGEIMLCDSNKGKRI